MSNQTKQRYADTVVLQVTIALMPHSGDPPELREVRLGVLAAGTDCLSRGKLEVALKGAGLSVILDQTTVALAAEQPHCKRPVPRPNWLPDETAFDDPAEVSIREMFGDLRYQRSRIMRVLGRLSISKAGQLAEHTERQIFQADGMGNECMDTICIRMRDLGLEFKREEPEAKET